MVPAPGLWIQASHKGQRVDPMTQRRHEHDERLVCEHRVAAAAVVEIAVDGEAHLINSTSAYPADAGCSSWLQATAATLPLVLQKTRKPLRVFVGLGFPRAVCGHTVGVASTDAGVGTRTLRGMFWAYSSYVGGRILVLVSIAILARLLTPSEFGLVAFALTVTALLDTVADLGVSQALIVVKDDEVHAKADTAWTLSVILGTVLTAITAALGPVAAAFFDEPALKVLLPLLGANFLIRALGVTHFALAQKQIDFRTRTAAEMADVIVRGAVGIGLALWGAGAYSLVWGYLAGSAALTLTLWALVPWRPSPRLRRRDLGSLLRFGGGLTVLDILSAFLANIDYIFVGRVLGKTKLGLYTLGFRLPELIIVNVSVVAGLVLFPAFAGIDRRELSDAFLTSLRYLLMLCVPLAVGLALLAEPVVLLAFGDQWEESVAVMQVLTLYAFAVTVGIPAGTAYKSIGRVDVLIKLAVPRALVAAGAIALFVDQGIVAVAACQAGVAALFSMIGIIFAARLLETRPRRICSVVWPPLVAGAVLAAVVTLVTVAVEDRYATLVVAAAAGAVTYLGTLWLIAPAAVRKLWHTAFPGRAPSPVEPVAPYSDAGHDPLAARLAAGDPSVASSDPEAGQREADGRDSPSTKLPPT